MALYIRCEVLVFQHYGEYTMSISAAGIMCLALTLYHEARSESLVGQTLVAQVVLNRADGDSSKICRTVLRKGQFSPNLKKSLRITDLKTFKKLKILSENIIKKGRVNKVTHFHNISCTPTWSRSKKFIRIAKIGSHIFYKEVASAT